MILEEYAGFSHLHILVVEDRAFQRGILVHQLRAIGVVLGRMAKPVTVG